MRKLSTVDWFSWTAFVVSASIVGMSFFAFRQSIARSVASVEPSRSIAPAGGNPTPGQIDGGTEALRYARAVQEGFCEEIIRNTAWMSDRMRRVSLEAASQEERDAAWDELCARATARPIEGNRVLVEGIEDQYMFAPGAAIEVVGVDAGRPDLDRVWKRVWLRVTFPRKQTAPLATTKARFQKVEPLHSVTVGVNLSDEGRVLKASIVGNLDVDEDSYVFDWEADGGA